jgi:hypothetical protein
MITAPTEILVDKFVNLPDYLQQEVMQFVDSLTAIYKQSENTTKKTEIDDQLKQLLQSRKYFSQKHPETRTSWVEVRNEIAEKYDF